MSSDKKSLLMVIAMIVAFAAALTAQWRVNLSSRISRQPNGAVTSIRYGYTYQPSMISTTRLLPSESRYLTYSSGLLPSQNLMLRQQAGLLPSQGRAAHLQSLALGYNPVSVPAYAPFSSIRYGNSDYYQWGNVRSNLLYARFDPSGTRYNYSPLSNPISTAFVPTWSIRYGQTNSSFTSSSTQLAQTRTSLPSVAPLTSCAASSAFPVTSPLALTSASPMVSQSIRYGQTGGFVPR
jgi:hypothetical protein